MTAAVLAAPSRALSEWTGLAQLFEAQRAGTRRDVTVKAVGSTSTLTSICASVAVMSTFAGSARRTQANHLREPPLPHRVLHFPSVTAPGSDLPRAHAAQVHRRAAIQIDRGPPIGVQPATDRLRLGKNAARQEGLQISGRQA